MKMLVQAVGCGGGDYGPTHSLKRKKSCVLTFQENSFVMKFLIN